MNWYKGNIAEAVAMSKSKSAIFVVYIEGKDEMTQKLTKFLNETKIKNKLESEDFVAIKIESDSQAYLQFAKIYQVVPVPSIFFIGHAGTPLDIGTGIMSTSEELEQKIEKVLMEAGKYSRSAASSSTSLISAERSSVEQTIALDKKSSASSSGESTESYKVVCEGDVCRKVPEKQAEEAAASAAVTTQEEQPSKEPTKEQTAAAATAENTAAATATPATAATTPSAAETPSAASAEDMNARLEETRKLLEEKRRERIEVEKQQEKEAELRRRREGKDLQQLQSWQKDQELKELKENIRRERLEEQAARERIRAQIAADRAERAEKNAEAQMKADATASVKPTVSTPPAPTSSTDSARLQFRLSTGENKSEIFNCHDTLSIVRMFVQSELLPGTGIRDFILATNYPKREFSAEDDERTLLELGLAPSAVILVIAREGRATPSRIIARSGGIINMVSTLFWALMSPFVAVFGYVRNIAGPKSSNAPGSTTGGQQTGAQKRANEEQAAQQDAAKRRFLERFSNGPSTSSEAATSPMSHQTQQDANDAKPYRRYVGGSNIHRLSDKRKDSDDENATWNGNSTQQQ